jgi:hypothetical protein
MNLARVSANGKAPRTEALCFSYDTYWRFAARIGLGVQRTDYRAG